MPDEPSTHEVAERTEAKDAPPAPGPSGLKAPDLPAEPDEDAAPQQIKPDGR